MLNTRNVDTSDETNSQRAAAYAAYRESQIQLDILQKTAENETDDARALREAASQNKKWNVAKPGVPLMRTAIQ